MTWAMHKYLSFSSGPVILLVGCVGMVVGIMLLKKYRLVEEEELSARGEGWVHAVHYNRQRNEMMIVDFSMPHSAIVAAHQEVDTADSLDALVPPPRYSQVFYDPADVWQHRDTCTNTNSDRCQCIDRDSYVIADEDSAPPVINLCPPSYESVIQGEHV